MKTLIKILTFWIPIRSVRRTSRNKLTAFFYSFIKLNNNWVICYDTFSKNGNGDSIYPISKEIKKRNPKIKLFFVAKENKEIELADEVLIEGSKRFYDVLMRAKYLVSPMTIPSEKRKGQIWIMTWHGTPLKKLYLSREKTPDFINYVSLFKNADYFCISNPSLKEIYAESMLIKKEQFLESGLPRNDILFTQNNLNKINEIKQKLGVPTDKKILFYCPTWRRYDWKQPMPFDLNELKKHLSDKYCILLRSHVGKHSWISEEGKPINLEKDDFAFDVNNYGNVSELFLISDIHITDYSSSVFDFANLCRPQILYAYDLAKYTKEFGLYENYETFSPFPVVKTEKELINAVIKSNVSASSLKKFKERFCTYENGSATKQIVNIITKGKK